MRITVVQFNPIIADVAGNLAKLLESLKRAEERKSDLILLPELCLTGYPPRDLLNRRDLIEENILAKRVLVQYTKELSGTLAFGYAEWTGKDGCKPLYNALCVAAKGEVLQTRFKTLLPTYDVFEEYRYFEPGPRVFQPIKVKDKMVGFINCEEAWNDKEFWDDHLYDVNPVAEMVRNGANYIACINASPYRKGVPSLRRAMVSHHSKVHRVGFVYGNMVGYNDEVGFDGNSFATNEAGEVIAHAQSFQPEDLTFDTDYRPIIADAYEIPWQAEMLLALRLGIRDYFSKLNITGPAIIGLSGGIDSALVAYLATTALGKDRVVGVGMPSEFSSDGSVSDAEKIAKTLGIHFAVQPIVVAHTDTRTAVDCINHFLTGGDKNGNGPDNPHLFGKKITLCKDSGVTDENLQARIRGLYLMALSNYYNGLVLSTGNKSEMAVGYCTLYGDMCGGLAVISDVYKTQVFDLCRYINETMMEEIIPWNTINKPPSAELRSNQKDQDSLPPYETLDAVLYRLVDEQKEPKQIYGELHTENNAISYLRDSGRNLETDIAWIINTVARNEFKRKQAPAGLKVSNKLFKYGWQYPIVHKMKTVLK